MKAPKPYFFSTTIYRYPLDKDPDYISIEIEVNENMHGKVIEVKGMTNPGTYYVWDKNVKSLAIAKKIVNEWFKKKEVKNA